MRPSLARLAPLIVSPFIACSNAYAQQSTPTPRGVANQMPNAAVELVSPETMPKSVGYSQVAVVHGGTLVFVSGQVALDKQGNLVGAGDFRAQTQQMFENLKAALQAAGGTFSDVVKLNTYALDLSPSNLAAFREVRDRYVNAKIPPTSTAVQVGGLFRTGFLVEVEAVAVVKK